MGLRICERPLRVTHAPFRRNRFSSRTFLQLTAARNVPTASIENAYLLVFRFRHLLPVSAPLIANVGIMRNTSKPMILV